MTKRRRHFWYRNKDQPYHILFLRLLANLGDLLVGTIGFLWKIEGDFNIILSSWLIGRSVKERRKRQATESHIWKYPSAKKDEL